MTPGGQWIFVSYRRSDTGDKQGADGKPQPGHASALVDALRRRFSPGAVFFDQDGTAWGDDFDRQIADCIGQAHVVLVLIGPGWLSSFSGREPPDHVRIEVNAALQRAGTGCTVIPMLFDGAVMPGADALKRAGLVDGIDPSLTTKNAVPWSPNDNAALLGALCQRIDTVAVNHLPAGLGDLSRAAAIRHVDELAAQVFNGEIKHLPEIADQWRENGVRAALPASAADAIFCFAQALEHWNEWRRLQPVPLPAEGARGVRACCLQLLSALLACAIDRLQARILVARSLPIPAAGAGLSAASFRAGHGKWPALPDDPERVRGDGDFKLTWHLHLDEFAPHPGTLSAQRDVLMLNLFKKLTGTTAKQLEPKQAANLPHRLAARRLKPEGAIVVSAETVSLAEQQALRDLVQGLGVDPLPFTQVLAGRDGEARNLCYEDQVKVRAAVTECCDMIQEIR